MYAVLVWLARQFDVHAPLGIAFVVHAEMHLLAGMYMC
jgi:hypothetical protein